MVFWPVTNSNLNTQISLHLFYGHRLHKLTLSIKSRLCNCQLSWTQSQLAKRGIRLFSFFSFFCLGSFIVCLDFSCTCSPPSEFFPHKPSYLNQCQSAEFFSWLYLDRARNWFNLRRLPGLLFLLALCLSVSILCKNAGHQTSAFSFALVYMFLFTNFEWKKVLTIDWIRRNQKQWEKYDFFIWIRRN